MRRRRLDRLYEGEWKEDELTVQGWGTMVKCEKMELIYTGWFKDNKPNGKGRMLFTDGTIYEGDWCDGLLNGEG